MPSVRLISKLGVRRFGLLLPGLALLALVSGIAGFRISEAMGLAELRQTGRHRLDLYGASLEREIDKYAYFPATLGLERDVLDLVARGAPVGEAVNRYLEQLNQRVGRVPSAAMAASSASTASTKASTSENASHEVGEVLAGVKAVTICCGSDGCWRWPQT